ncbi:hypothetical protein BS50DRAFT_42541 [Corynespora cassiicola Philippines]|uniref:Integral membrane protein n=1 Tax=Corynespora cassiicola Philippines TaxID=1448308 RepID=A0A2T2PDA8_CORCC|nr:hypothetical protein BS50DRAFT_42541 [Corynespora cassiicola Philippines]
MNASATIRSNYVRQSRILIQPLPFAAVTPIPEIEPRPPNQAKLRDFKPLNYAEHRERCHRERFEGTVAFDVHTNSDTDLSYIDDRYLEDQSYMELDGEKDTFRQRVKKMFTVFPYRDPIYLVAIIFTLGSLDLVINAFFDLIPRAVPGVIFENEKEIASPSTILIGAIFFFVAGIFDIFGALNADAGTMESDKEAGNVKYRPALLGSPGFKWIPPREKFLELLLGNLAFQAGLLVLFGGVIFLFAGVVDFPGVVPEELPDFAVIVFGPQVIHGFLFFVANLLLALFDQEKWYKPAYWDPEWQGAALNTIGGFGFMVVGLELFNRGEVEVAEFRAAVAAMVGSWAFFIGSLVRLYSVMEFA